MQRLGWPSSVRGLARVWLLAAIMGPALMSGNASAQYWGSYGADPQHTCLSGVASQLPQRVLWRTARVRRLGRRRR